MSTPTPPPMILGVWQQPQANFSNWVARGCNTLCQIPTNGGTPWTPAQQQAWVTAAEADSLWQIRVPVPNVATDNAPHLLALAQSDEFDANAIPVALFQVNYKAWKAAKPNTPVFINASGGYVLQYQPSPSPPGVKWTATTYAPYIACGDWCGTDFYPGAWSNPITQAFLLDPGACVTTFSGYSGGKRQIAFIETGSQGIGPNGTPTAGNVRLEAWNAVMMGATGIIYFPCQLEPVFSFDNSSPDVVAALPSLNAEFAAIGPYLGPGLKAAPLSVNPTLLYGEVKTGTNQLNALFNTLGTAQSYSGVQLAPFGAFCVLVTPTAQTVLVQTPMPIPLDQRIAALTATVNAQGVQIAGLNSQMSAIAKAAGN